VDSVVSVSNNTLDAHRSWGYFRNTEGSVIYNVATFPVPSQSVYVDPDPGHLVFGFIGQLLESKGIRVLLKATKNLKNPLWKLRIAGAGVRSYVQALKDEYPDPRIEWLGFRVASEFYKSIHVTIVPSVWPEPLPYVIVESHLNGRPIICSDIGGIPEISRLGRKAKLFAANDCQGLSNLMDDAIEHRDEWMLGGFREISSIALFSQEEVVERYRCVYRGDG
jgi:glycosyltransferase involved in cell wall biosynthesis